MIESILAQALIYMSVGLFVFAYRAKVYKITNVVFYFYMSVFTLSLVRSLYEDKNILIYGDFFNVHLLVVSILFLIVIVNFFKRPKKYLFIVPLIAGSVLVMWLFLIYKYEYFFIVHNGVLLINMLVVTWFVLHQKSKQIRGIRKITFDIGGD